MTIDFLVVSTEEVRKRPWLQSRRDQVPKNIEACFVIAQTSSSYIAFVFSDFVYTSYAICDQ